MGKDAWVYHGLPHDPIINAHVLFISAESLGVTQRLAACSSLPNLPIPPKYDGAGCNVLDLKSGRSIRGGVYIVAMGFLGYRSGYGP